MRSMFLLMTGMLFSMQAAAFDIQYTIPLPDIDSTGNVTGSKMYITGQPGAPAVPIYPLEILLPPGTIASEVAIEYGERIELGEYQLTPVQQQFPVSESAAAVPTERDAALWSRPGELPIRENADFSTHFLAGHSILLTHACPIRYDPVTQRLSYYRDFNVRVTTIQGEQSFPTTARDRERVSNLVDNPLALQNYNQRVERTDGYEYLVVAPGEIAVYFQQLVNWRNSLGMRSRLVTIEEAITGWDGVDDAERLRNFLIAEYQEHGFHYLLLGGDIDLIPFRSFYAHTSMPEYTDDLPADLYFACLDGSWDANQNGIWGEVGEEDWFPELSVGRASISTVPEAAYFINKQLGYQRSPVTADLARCLMIGEELDDTPTWGGTCKDEIRFGSTANGIETTGLPDNLDVALLYDREGVWTTDDLFSQLEQGVNLVNHLGHCGINSLMRMNNSDVNIGNLTANGFSNNFHIGYSQGCHAGAFDSNDCIIERVTNLATGFAAFIGNSRYGWYQSDCTGGASQLFDREFFDALFGENIATIGDALQDSRDDLAAWAANSQHIRWVYYGLNLFGDPALQPWTQEPLDIQINYEPVVSVGLTELAVHVQTEDTPVEDLRVTVLLDGEIMGCAFSDISGNALVEFAPALEIVGEYDLMISGRNCLPTHLPLQVTSITGPYLVLSAQELSDSLGNGNNLPEAGEELQLLITLLNVGVQDATFINAVLSSSTDGIEVTMGTVSLPDISPGEEGAATMPFELSVASGIADLQSVVCNLDITCNGDIWSEDIELVLHLPQMHVTSLTVLDDDDEVLNPGETAPLAITILNDGSGWATDYNAVLMSSDFRVMVDVSADSFLVLLPEEEENLHFQLTADPDIEDGALVMLSLRLTPAFGPVVTLDIPLVIGQRWEGFETGDFNSYEWTFGGDAEWFIDNTNPFEGRYCARSGPIDHNQHTSLSIYHYVPLEGMINFRCRTSSQSYFDLLRFFIDDVEQIQWSGETDWMEATLYVSPGWHTYSWDYSKSVNISIGDDCAWLDAIIVVGPPPQMGELDIAVIDEQVRLTWQSDPGFDSYRIYEAVSPDGPWQQIAETTATSYLCPRPFMNCFYQVTGVWGVVE
jgi:hypothetical protein